MRRALFLHIQKTAGTSIIEAIKSYGGLADKIISHGDFISHEPSRFQNNTFVSGHFGYEYGRHLMDGRFTFTFLRDPIERVLSLYYFCKSQNPNQFPIYKLARELSLENFIDAAISGDSYRIRAHIFNNQVWQLAHGYDINGAFSNIKICNFEEERLLDLAFTHLNHFSYVGTRETLDDDCAKIFTSLGIENLWILPRANVTKENFSKFNLSSSVMEKIMQLTRLDQSLYEFVVHNRKNNVS